MVKTGGGSGRGENAGGNSEYGAGIKVTSNTMGNSADLSFVSYSDISKRVIVSPVTEGSERQQQYANNLKVEAMRYMDETISKVLSNNPGATREQRAKILDTRNKILRNINSQTSASRVIDSLGNGNARRYDAIMRTYNK